MTLPALASASILLGDNSSKSFLQDETLSKENKYLGWQEMAECSVTAWVAWRRGKGNRHLLFRATKARRCPAEPGDGKFRTSQGDALS